jgi:hypothetical protein
VLATGSSKICLWSKSVPEDHGQLGERDAHWTRNRRELAEWLGGISPSIAELYQGAVELLFHRPVPGFSRFVSHAVREIRNRLPQEIWEHSSDDSTADRYAGYDRDRNNNYAYNRDRDNGNDYDRDRDAHQHFAAQIAKNPSLCKDHDYLQNHPELQAYLSAHPEVRQPLTSDLDTFMTHQFNNNGQGGQTGKMPAPTATQPGTSAHSSNRPEAP